MKEINKPLLLKEIDEFRLLFREIIIKNCFEVIDPKEKLSRTVVHQMAEYKKHLAIFPEETLQLIFEMLITHRMVKKNGLLQTKYRDLLDRQCGSDIKYAPLLDLHLMPPRFVFCQIDKRHGDDFFQAFDFLAQEKFLLYSPTITNYLDTGSSLFLFLALFTPDCAFSFNVVLPFKGGIQPFDLHYFAKLFDSEVATLEDACRQIERTPLPFLLLANAGGMPHIVSKRGKRTLSLCLSTIPRHQLDPESLGEKFFVRKSGSLYQLRPKHWHRAPHFCEAYYDAKKSRLTIFSLTRLGYAKLFNELKLPVQWEEPQYEATPAMNFVSREITGKDPFDIEELRRRFEKEQKPDPVKDEMMEKANAFLQNIIVDLNARRPIDVEKKGREARLTPEEAWNIYNSVMESLHGKKKSGNKTT